MLVLVYRACHNWSVCLWGLTSCHRQSAHSSGGVFNHIANGIKSCVGSCLGMHAMIGRGTCMLFDMRIGVMGTVFCGPVVRLLYSWYCICIGVCWDCVKATHLPS